MSKKKSYFSDSAIQISNILNERSVEEFIYYKTKSEAMQCMAEIESVFKMGLPPATFDRVNLKIVFDDGRVIYLKKKRKEDVEQDEG